MSSQAVATLLRKALDDQLQAWKDERSTLLNAQARIAELDELIDFVEQDSRSSMDVDPRSNGNGNGNGNGQGSSTRNPTG